MSLLLIMIEWIYYASSDHQILNFNSIPIKFDPISHLILIKLIKFIPFFPDFNPFYSNKHQISVQNQVLIQFQSNLIQLVI